MVQLFSKLVKALLFHHVTLLAGFIHCLFPVIQSLSSQCCSSGAVEGVSIHLFSQ